MRAIVATALLLASLSTTAAELVPFSESQRTALGIETAPATAIESRFSARLPAKVAVPNAQLQVIAAPQDGLIEVLLATEGEAVKQGQVLARIQSPAFLELQSQYLETLARFNLAESSYRRDQQLHKEGVIAQRRLFESKAQYQELAASLSRARQLLKLAGMDEKALAQLDSQRELSGALTVRAPFDGVILQQLVTAGQRVEVADPLYHLATLKPLWLEIQVPLEQLGGMQIGQQVQLPELELSGKVISIGQSVHGTDQGVMIRAEISEGAERLRPGQFVQVQMEIGTGGNSYRVPRSAVFRSQGKSYLFGVQAEGFQPIEVRILGEESAHLIVQADLPADSQVVVAGVAALKAAWLGGDE